MSVAENQANKNSDSTPANSQPAENRQESFVEVAYRLSGKSEAETQKTAAIDRADDQVEQLFEHRHQTVNSPVHQVVWNHDVPETMLHWSLCRPTKEQSQLCEHAASVLKEQKRSGQLRNEQSKVSQSTFERMGATGYWGWLIEKQFEGQELPFQVFSKFLTTIATIDPTVAGLGSVHGCIGAVDPLSAFGNEQQKQHYLPQLATGKKLSGFALTEPGAGSDLTALQTTAVLNGDHYLVTGEKLFITNAIWGRTVGLVCLIEGKPAVLIADLPEQPDETFELVEYGLHALKHSYNNGMKFRNFKVPAANLLEIEHGDGLTIAYHGLNRGRVALCATAAGTMRLMMANMLPWIAFRKTYGQAIQTRDLVKRRIGKLAGLIVASDALVDWCAWLLDQGYRGEMECIVAKVFGSEAQKTAAIELFMKTHGGRSFLHGHLFGDNVHEFLAPCIYEGEGEMLSMAFLKSLIKQHGKTYYEPVGYALKNAGIKTPQLWNPSHLWALRSAAMPYAKWRAGEFFSIPHSPILAAYPEKLRGHAAFALQELQTSRMKIDGLMQRFQLGLADRQCEMVALSQRLMNLITLHITVSYAAQHSSDIIQAAADVAARELTSELTGRKLTTSDYRAETKLADAIVESGFPGLEHIDPEEILMPYVQQEEE